VEEEEDIDEDNDEDTAEDMVEDIRMITFLYLIAILYFH
jgi:hypothetical protein